MRKVSPDPAVCSARIPCFQHECHAYAQMRKVAEWVTLLPTGLEPVLAAPPELTTAPGKAMGHEVDKQRHVPGFSGQSWPRTMLAG